MLDQVYNIVLNLPDNIVTSIPSLKSPSVLVELKRMRQKLKNKIKIGRTRLMNEYSKPSTSSNNIICNLISKRTSSINGLNTSTSTNSQYEKNSTKYESTFADNSRLSTTSTSNQTDGFNDSNTNTNKWFNNHPDFETNLLPKTQAPSNTDIYSRERLSVNELGCIVNDNNFDSFSVSDVQKSIQTCSINNNSKHIQSEVKKVSPQNSYEKGKK